MSHILKRSVIFLLLIFLTSCGNKKLIKLEVSDAIKNANEYIYNANEIVDTTYKNTYHLNPPVGWINDPNGFSEFSGKYNLFYQYNPYNAVWGPMHWGHQQTTDFIKWDLVDVALAPDMTYDQNGCFSGTAIVDDNKLYICYTAVSDKQNQGLAYSYDGITFNKIDNLLIDGAKDLKDGFSNDDFRDPKIFKKNDKYYILTGSKNSEYKGIIMFEADKITGPYEYKGMIYGRSDVGGILECPDYTTIDGNDVLIFSPQSIKSDENSRFQNSDSSTYLIGRLSTNTYHFYYDSDLEIEEFDKGFSFYAPQTLNTRDGRTIMIAWMRSWSEPNTTQSQGWCGAMTLPRELTIKENHIYQSPVREINKYLKNQKSVNDITLDNESIDLEDLYGRVSKISLELDISEMNGNGICGIELFKNSNYKTVLSYSAKTGLLSIDRNNCGSSYYGTRYCKINTTDRIKLDIYLDNNSIEVFVNEGYYTMTANIYSPTDCNMVSFFTENCEAKFKNIEKYDIVL